MSLNVICVYVSNVLNGQQQLFDIESEQSGFSVCIWETKTEWVIVGRSFEVSLYQWWDFLRYFLIFLDVKKVSRYFVDEFSLRLQCEKWICNAKLFLWSGTYWSVKNGTKINIRSKQFIVENFLGIFDLGNSKHFRNFIALLTVFQKCAVLLFCG